MTTETTGTFIAFEGDRRVASGSLAQVAGAVKRMADRSGQATVLVFDAATSRPVELDLRGGMQDVAARYAEGTGSSEGDKDPVELRAEPRPGPGRPRLGVIAKEVTLLPRHWAWLGSQRGGASATLRRLVDQARRASVGSDRVRESQDATYRFMLAVAGDRPRYEEAVRALYGDDAAGFEACIRPWPPDIAEHSRGLAEGAFGAGSGRDDRGG